MDFTELQVTPDIDRAPWTDLETDANDGALAAGQLERVGLMRHSTAEGRAAVYLVARLDDGSALVVQTTWRLFNAAALALAASPIAAEET
jgi:hypothetical protein